MTHVISWIGLNIQRFHISLAAMRVNVKGRPACIFAHSFNQMAAVMADLK